MAAACARRSEIRFSRPRCILLLDGRESMVFGLFGDSCPCWYAPSSVVNAEMFPAKSLFRVRTHLRRESGERKRRTGSTRSGWLRSAWRIKHRLSGEA